jgi:hypothetical protein
LEKQIALANIEMKSAQLSLRQQEFIAQLRPFSRSPSQYAGRAATRHFASPKHLKNCFPLA